MISRSVLLRKGNVSNKSCTGNEDTLSVYSNLFQKIAPFRGNVEKYSRARQATDDNIIRRMRVLCCINKAPDRHSEYVIFIASLRQE